MRHGMDEGEVGGEDEEQQKEGVRRVLLVLVLFQGVEERGVHASSGCDRISERLRRLVCTDKGCGYPALTILA